MLLGGISRADAEKCFATMKRLKVVKVDSLGQYRVTHGELLDKDVIRRAVNFNPKKRST